MLFTDGDAARLIVGLVAVPPVVILEPAFTLFTVNPGCANILYKFVPPDNIVPPDNVVADNDVNVPAAACTFPPIAVPENVMLFTDGDAARLITGAAAVPPVVMFEPG